MNSAMYSDTAAQVNTETSSYPIWVGWEIYEEIGERVNNLIRPEVAYLITDQNSQKHARSIQVSLEKNEIKTHIFIMESGEIYKTLDTVRHAYEWLAKLKAERNHLVLAVGGGVVGDLAGFVAATFLRGMPFGQVPTSLLAVMDASVGGKVAVDLPYGKNMVGAFYQPKFVMSDVSFLKTLDQRQLNSGWSEAIKHSLIVDRNLFDEFQTYVDDITSFDPDVTTNIIRRSVAIKADVVSKDEKETLGIRILLNYGHTIGHAIEAITGYSKYLHGEAVSIGMMGAAHISHSLGILSGDEVDLQRAVLDSYKLPTRALGLNKKQIIESIKSDKKTVSGDVTWVLLEKIGKSLTRRGVSRNTVMDALDMIIESKAS